MTARRLTNTSTSLDKVVASSSPPKSTPAESNRSKPPAKETPKSLPVPDNKTEKPVMTTQGVTFASQEKLPKLPIPDLDKSCNKYLSSLRPLQSAREHAETEVAVQEFLRAEGPELQEKLKKYATGKSSYIEQFCTFKHHSLHLQSLIC
jgi:carnitine O-acetyltransferase